MAKTIINVLIDIENLLLEIKNNQEQILKKQNMKRSSTIPNKEDKDKNCINVIW